MSRCWGENNNSVVVIEGSVDVTLKPNQQLVVPGTVQVYPNSEFSKNFPTTLASQQTHLTIPPHTPGAA